MRWWNNQVTQVKEVAPWGFYAAFSSPRILKFNWAYAYQARIK